MHILGLSSGHLAEARMMNPTSLMVFEPKIQPQYQCKNATDQHYNEEAPPLHFPCPACMPGCCIQLGVALVNILHDIRRPLLDLHRRIFLYLYLFSQLLEEKAEFSDGRLDALDLVVPGAH